MPEISARDLLLLPNLISYTRLPLGALFPLVADRPLPALAVLALAGFTDMLDGWVARGSKHATATGAVIDPICDKLFAMAVVVTLVVQERIPLWGIVALCTREVLQLPLVLWIGLSPRFRGARFAIARANIPGKAATVLQFAAVLAAIAWPPALTASLWAAAVAGVGSGVSYWIRQIRHGRGATAG
ncbi:CDP-alcohol phosphatidyltransferase family protein [Chondromyces apiculatus]|uniref:CDP-diacylglycerol--glycerol-3-phosphate 3-phosphatidyltransferase n=1 Tax=Chondromyces apiculatus DSM 436 TaxID=1192034 RepID=A0A017T3Z4_9BACT|nr:CDP-alcohol phosphatidyltransferase family protein [Chondromyces apiculatus]EYF03969.1 putative CDP-diacylglycerol--glycerol-3-phosphate 3-phosphatidyl-transferase [Chondromyces apiculatus DSM 436]